MADLEVYVVGKGVEKFESDMQRVTVLGETAAQKVGSAFAESAGRSRQVLETQLNTLSVLTANWATASDNARDIAVKLAASIEAEGRMAGATAAQVRQLAESTSAMNAINAQDEAVMRRMIGVQGQAIAEDEARTAAIRRMALAQIEAIAVDQARTAALIESANVQAASTGATQLHGLQLGRLNQELGTFIGRITGSNTAATRLTAQIGGAVIGYGTMIVTLGAVALALGAVEGVYHLLTDAANKAREVEDKLVDSLYNEARAAEAATRAGRVQAIDQARVAVARLAAEYQHLAEVQALATGASETNPMAGLLVDSDKLKFKNPNDPGGPDPLTKAVIALEQAYRNLTETAKKEDDRLAKSANAAQAIRATIDARREELAKQLALNAAFGQSADELKILELRYDAMIEKSHNLKTAHGAVAGELNKLTDAMLAARIAGVQQAAVAEDQEKTLEHLRDSLKNTNAEWTVNASRYAIIADAQVKFTALEKEAGKIAAENIATTKKQTDETANAIKAQIKYADDMQRIWADGFGKIITDGTKSFHDFFEDVLQMFSKLVARMKQEGKGDSFGAQALGYGSAAIAGGFAGYSIGQSTGSTAAGVFGGAASGAIAGGSIAGTWGAVIGGFTGVIGGLFGAASAQQKAAEQLQAAAAAYQRQLGTFVAQGSDPVTQRLAGIDAQVDTLLENLRNLINAGPGSADDKRRAYEAQTGVVSTAALQQKQKVADDFFAGIVEGLNALNGPAGVYANQLAAIKKQYDDNIASAKALNATAEQLAQIEALRAAQEKALADALALANKRASEDYRVRALNASGQTQAGSALAFQLQQAREMEDAIKAGMDPNTLALLASTQALESVAFAAQQLQAAMNQAHSDIQRDVSLGFTTPQAAIEQERQTFGFGGLTNDQIRNLYTPFSGTALTPAQETLNQNIKTFFDDLAALMGQGPAAPGSGGTVAGAGLGERNAISNAAQALTEVTGNRLADYNAAMLIVQRQILDVIRSGLYGGGSSIAPYTANLTAPATPVSGGGSGTSLTPFSSAASFSRVAPVSSSPATAQQPVVVQVTIDRIEVTAPPGADPYTFGTEVGRGIRRQLADLADLGLAEKLAGKLARDGDPIRTGR
jgi:hypothetical protein